jgi:ABC-type nitrate/sulfonate/bicarbonate transport system substrate-binding protein
VLQTANLTVNDAQFINAATAGRLPGLVAGQVDGVALHPEDVYLAEKQKPSVHTLVRLDELLPNYAFNSYGASNDFIAKDPALIRDTVAGLIEGARAIYQQKDKAIPIIMQATEKPQDAVEYAYQQETKNCNWAVNTGFEQARTEWTANWAVDNGDVQATKKPSFDQVVDTKVANEGLAAAGGPTTIGNCKA